MLREPVPAEQLAAATHVVQRIRAQRCITAADLRAEFATMTDRREAAGGREELARCDSTQSLWGTRGTTPEAQRVAAEANGSLAEGGDEEVAESKAAQGGASVPVAGEGEAKAKAEAGEGEGGGEVDWEKHGDASFQTAQEAGVAHGPDVQVGEDEALPGVFAPKAKARTLNAAQWLCTAEHHAGRWWGVRQLFRVWDQWHEAIVQAGEPTRQQGWKSLIKANEFLVTNLWSYLVSPVCQRG